MIKVKIAKASITWREELVEDKDSFYIRLSPDVVYNEYDMTNIANEVGKEAVRQIKKNVKGVK